MNLYNGLRSINFFKKYDDDNKPGDSMKSPIEFLNTINFEVGFIDIVLSKNIKTFHKSYYTNNLYNFNIFTLNPYMKDKSIKYLNDYTFKNVFSNRSFIYIFDKEKDICSFDMAFNLKNDSNIIANIKKLLKDPEGMKLLSNYNAKNNISVKTSTFFNYLGYNNYLGGAERYLIDLYVLCKSLNFNMDIYQHGEIPFFRKYKNVNVIGLKVKNEKINGNDYSFIDKQTKNYIYHTFNNTILHIYSSFQECYPNHIGPSIGISHGISWDNPENNFNQGKDFFWEKKKSYLIGASFCNKLISVDNNTPNWFQTIDYNLGNKFQVIPNYVDILDFKTSKISRCKKKKIVITYPRRLCEARGLYIVLDILDEILAKYPNVEFHFVGRGCEEDEKKLLNKIKEYPERVKCYSKKPEEMKSVYQNSDICLIPTLFSEGTSLSCLEALISGNIVITTRIGGLTDLVINNYNGYLINPNKDSLKEKLIEVLDNFANQNKVRKNAIETAKTFSKEKWLDSWRKVISEFKLSGASNTNDLIEIYINDLNKIGANTRKIIIEELLKGNLIYLRVKNLPDIDNISNGLLQVVSVNEEIVSVAKLVYKEKNYQGKIVREEKVVEI